MSDGKYKTLPNDPELIEQISKSMPSYASNKPNDGGPAFPVMWDEGGERVAVSGMSLRDYFAVHAIIGKVNVSAPSFETIAQRAYELADAMIKARGQ